VQVIHVIPALFSPKGGVIGGAERYALELARHMADKIPTRLVTFADEPRTERIGDLQIDVIGGARYIRGQRGNPIVIRSLLRLLREGDVIHCHQQHVTASSLAALFCRLTKRRVFVSDLGGGGWDISTYVSTNRWYHGHLHISEYSRRIYGQATFRRAHVIFGGVDVQKFSPDHTVRKTGAVLFVGRILPHKGINYLIEALPAGASLEVIGQPYDSRFLKRLKSLSLGKQVTFHHDCDDQTLIGAYRRSACIVLPSVYRTVYGDETIIPELLGQTLLEGMACGLPAICTDVASMPEIVEDGVSGFVVAPNSPERLRERLSWILNNTAQAQQMGTAARQRVLERFSWDRVVDRCLESYTFGRTSAN
jgi:glycosyltransferase involved in cell wall biosynthesis